MSDFTSYLKQQLDNPEFRAEYEALEPDFSPIQAKIDARKDTTMTPMDEEQWGKKLAHSLAQARKGEKSDASTLTARIRTAFPTKE